MLVGCIPELPILDDPCVAWDEPGIYSLTIDRPDTKKRKAYVNIPPGAGPRPVVVMLHGAGQSLERIADATRWIRLGKDEGAVVVFPKGIWQSWNAGYCCAIAREDARDIDDVGNLDELARTVRERTCGTEVLASGFSNGGMMVHRWACQGTQVDAVLPAAGMLMEDQACNGPPVPIRHYHGLADETVPFEGGTSQRGLADYPSVEDAMAVWRQRNQCTDTVETFEIGDTTCQSWDCDGASTELCTLSGFGHLWPGGANRGPNQTDATTDGYAWFREPFEDSTTVR